MWFWSASLFSFSALAAPPSFVLDGPVTEQTYAEALERAVGEAAGPVTLLAKDAQGRLVPAESLLPAIQPPPQKEGDLRSWPADHPGSAQGFLNGKAIYLSQCHGWIWYDSISRFATQRGEHFDTVEDFHNPEGLNQFLAPYLENAGAAVFTAKERDLNPEMAIADNDGSGYSEEGAGFVEAAAGFAERATWPEGRNPFDEGTTRRFPADGGGIASWTPDVPVDGYYAVYVSWDSDPDHASDAHYRIVHDGGVIDRWFDQRVHGSTWQYTETLWLREGTDSLTVELVGDSSQSGKFLSADAVRIGGGMGDVVRNSVTTGRPRWEEGANLYVQYNGAPSSVYANDVSARSRWAAWEHPTGEDAVFLSWHSNACGTGDECSARGTVTYIYRSDCNNGAAATGSYDLAYAVNDELVGSFRELWDPSWPARGTNGVAQDCFGEVNPGHNNEMPSVLVELAFHNNDVDAGYLKEPRFRIDASRAMYRGIVRYFAERDGETPHYLPEPPTHVAVTHGTDGRLTVRWRPGPSGEPYGDAAQSYRVYTSLDGRAWDGGVEVDGTSYALDLPVGRRVFVRVAGVNEGGISFPSEVAGGLQSADGTAPVLVVGAFDRFDASMLPWESAGPTGNVRRLEVHRVNPRDAIAVHGRSIAALGWPFESASDEELTALDLSRYRAIFWAAGEESTADETLSDAQQAALRAFWDNGGALVVSGSEILWDLDDRGTASDRAFASEVLGATLGTDDAGTDDADPEGLLAGVGALDFGEANGGPAPIEYPDTLVSSRPVIARYDGGAIAGVYGDRVVLFGFPFEAIAEADVRDAVMARLLPELVPGYVPPEPEDPDTGDTGDGPGEDGDWIRHEIPGGCRCDGSGGAAAPWIALLALAVSSRRRRTGGHLGGASGACAQ